MKNFRNSGIDNSKATYWQWDIKADQIQLSESLRAYLGVNDVQTLSLNQWTSLFFRSDHDRINNIYQNFIENKGDSSLDFNSQIQLADGTDYEVFCSGETIERDKIKPLRVAGQLKIKPINSENSVHEFTDSYLLKLLMDRLPYSIYFKDLKSRFIRISRDCALKFGLDNADEAIGKTDFDFFDELHATVAYEDEKSILESGTPIIGKVEAERKPGNDVVKWASSTKLPIYDDQKNIIGTFGITKDVTAQLMAEQALKESEQKYRSIFENIQDVYYRTSRDGTITEISPSIENFSGFKREEVIGSPVSSFYHHKDDRNKLIEKLKKDGVVSDFEIRFTHADDKVVFTSVSANIIRDDEGEIIAVDGIMRDITERKLAELKIKETHNFYNQILSSTSEGIYVVDEEFRYIYWNSMMEKISGYSEDEVLGKKPNHLFPHVKQNKILSFIERAFKGDSTKSDDYYYAVEENSKSGWAQAYYTPLRNKNGKIDSVLVTILDISDRRAAEEKLRKSDDTLTMLSEQVPGAIYQFQQFPDGSSCFPFASKAFYNVYEIYPEEVKHDSKKALERIHKDDIELVAESINISFKSLENWELDYRVNLPDRGLRWLRGRARPQKQNDGSVIWHGYIADITEKKQNEHELNKTLDIVSDQNSRLLNFAHIVSHNLRNHAGNISSLLSLYEEENSEEEKTQLLSYLNMASIRLNEAISDLNEIIDQQSGSSKNINRVNLYDYFCKIKEILSTNIIIKNVSFDVSIPEDFEFEYNPAYLESILLNLISNAIKYSHPDRTPVIKICLSFEESGPILTVTDNGRGINLDKHGEQLFGMYNTFHQNEDSKGIGLYITKNQVESMGGSIKVESKENEGTTFRINLTCDETCLQKNLG